MRCRAALLVLLPGAAWAQAPAAVASPQTRAVVLPAPAVPPPAAAARKRGPPEARTGFQMHFVPLTGVLFPFGGATSGRGDSLSSRYGWQWMPLELGLGAKLIDSLYLGGYLNVGVGWEGSDLRTEAHCEAGNDAVDDVSCSAVSTRLGLELRYSFTPAESMNGWIGYGIGMTTGSQTISDAGRYSETSTAQGIELGRLTGGLDFRASSGFGLGPFALVSLGRYMHQKTEINGVVTSSGSIDNPALHAWVSLGLRMVIFP